GLNEIFILNTVISKTQPTPMNVDWMIGMRPNGSNQLPHAVQAIIMLNEIFKPYRKFYPTDRLLISLTMFGNLPFDKNRLGPIHSDRLRRDIKNFVGEWADFSKLGNESQHKIEDNDLIPWKTSNGRIIKTHQFRKTWAQFILATDPRLLPAIQMQFHHLVLAMTESGYIGRNPVQLEALNAVSRQQRNLLIYEAAMGKNLLAGKMGDNIEKNISILHEKIKDLPTSDAWKESVKFCDDNDLKIFFSPHGNCMPLRPTQMRCHESANTVSRFNIEPNYSTREPSLCAGCSCFIIDSRHINFWEDRYIQNAASYRQAEKIGSVDQFRAIKGRANQASKLLQKMGADMDVLESKILVKLRDITNG
ncbi:MAG: integrase, partial [Burkholderiales bacterium]|nr:integrase [Burkholderiales bacterium]